MTEHSPEYRTKSGQSNAIGYCEHRQCGHVYRVTTHCDDPDHSCWVIVTGWTVDEIVKLPGET